MRSIGTWIVTVEGPIPSSYTSRYFPRKFYYKSEALALANEVNAKGGKAKVEKI